MLCSDHRLCWKEFDLTHLKHFSHLVSLVLDLPVAWDVEHGDILAGVPHLKHLHISCLRLRNAAFFDRLARAPLVERFRVCINTNMQTELRHLGLFGFRHLTEMVIRSRSNSVGAMILWAATCRIPDKLSALVIDVPDQSTGTLRGKKHLPIDLSIHSHTRFQRVSTAPSYADRVFLDSSSMQVLFPNIQKLIVSPTFMRTHDLNHYLRACSDIQSLHLLN